MIGLTLFMGSIYFRSLYSIPWSVRLSSKNIGAKLWEGGGREGRVLSCRWKLGLNCFFSYLYIRGFSSLFFVPAPLYHQLTGGGGGLENSCWWQQFWEHKWFSQLFKSWFSIQFWPPNLFNTALSTDLREWGLNFKRAICCKRSGWTDKRGL